MTARTLVVSLALLLPLVGCKSAASTDPAPTAGVPAHLAQFEPLLGKTPDEAERWLAAHPTDGTVAAHLGGVNNRPSRVTAVRPIVVDGEGQAVTEDLRSDRLNVEVAGGKIVRLDDVY